MVPIAHDAKTKATKIFCRAGNIEISFPHSKRTQWDVTHPHSASICLIPSINSAIPHQNSGTTTDIDAKLVKSKGGRHAMSADVENAANGTLCTAFMHFKAMVVGIC